MLEGLGEAIGALDERAPFRELVERLRVSQAEVGEVERELRLAAEGIPDDPGRLDEVRGRRRALRELQRKYGETLAEVVAFADVTRQRIVELEGYEERAEALERRRQVAGDRAVDAARGLTETRPGPRPGRWPPRSWSTCGSSPCRTPVWRWRSRRRW